MEKRRRRVLPSTQDRQSSASGSISYQPSNRANRQGLNEALLQSKHERNSGGDKNRGSRCCESFIDAANESRQLVLLSHREKNAACFVADRWLRRPVRRPSRNR